MFISRYTQSNVWIFLVCLTCCSPNVAWEVAQPQQSYDYALILTPARNMFGETIDILAATGNTTSMDIFKEDLGTGNQHLPANYFYPLHIRGDRGGSTFSLQEYFYIQRYVDKVKQKKEEILCQIHKDFDNVGLWRIVYTQDFGDKTNIVTSDVIWSWTDPMMYQLITYDQVEYFHSESHQAGSVFYVNGQKEFAVPNSYEANFNESLAVGNAKKPWLWIFGLGPTLQYTWNETTTTEMKVNGVVITNASVHEVRLGETFNPVCGVRGVTITSYPVLNVNISCGEDSKLKASSLHSSLNYKVTQALDGVICRCSAKTHVLGCEFEPTQFTLGYVYEVALGYKDEEQPSICVGITPTVDMYCDVPRSDSYLMPSATVQGLPGGDLNLSYYETLEHVSRFNFSFTPLTSGAKIIRCMANNPPFDADADAFTVFVNDPPPTMSPNVTIDNGPVLTNGTVHKYRLDTHLDIECTVEGGTPPVSNVTLKCDDITNTTVNGTVVTLGLEISKDPSSVQCECSAEHNSNCYNKKTEFYIVSIYGPTQVVPGQYDKEDPSICDGIKPTVDMYCDVTRTDVHSIPSVTLHGLPGGDMNPVSNETLQDVHRFNFSFTPPTPGTNNLICVANNTVFNQIGTRQEFIVFVNEPPTMSPNVTINNGPVLTNGTVHNSRLGHLDIECTVEGGTPPVSNVTLKCDDITNTTVDGTVVTLGLEITKDPPSLKCECSAEHKSQCYNKKTEFDIVSIYGPTQVVPGQYDKEDPSICDGIKPTVDMYCDVTRTDVHSIPSVTLQGISGGDMNPASNETLQDVHRFNFSFTPPTPGTQDLICVANNTVFNQIGTRQEFVVFVNEPPTMTPNVTINNGLVLTNGTVYNSRLGHLDIECTVEGGTPPVSNVTLKCNDITNTTVDGTVVTLGLEITKDPPSLKCECFAEHKSHCYNKKTEFDIVSIYGPTHVIPGQYDKEDPSICDGIKPTVEMYCDVNITDVHSIPSVFLQGLPSGDMNPVSNETLQDVHRFNFSFTPPTPGTKDLICVANNTVFNQIGTRQEFVVFVNEPPTMTPNVTINNGLVLTNGTVHNSRLGHLDIECTVEGGAPPVSNVTLKCDDITNTTVDGTVVTLGLEITKDPPSLKCECFAEHKSHCDNKKTEFDIVSIYGPTQVVPGQYDKEDPSICDGIKPTVDMYCDVTRTDVHSIPSVTLQGLPSGDMNPASNETLQDVHRFNFSFTPLTPGTKDLICVANNTVFTDIGTRQEFIVFVNEPPAMSPNVTIINGPVLTIGTVHNSRLGHLDIECTVEGGTPPVSNVTLKCNDITNTIVDVTVVTLALEIEKTPNNLHCECFADHRSQCYNKRTQFTISPTYGPTTVTVGPPNMEAFDLCVGGKTNISLYCDINKNDVKPIPQVVLQGDFDNDLEPVDSLSFGNVIRHNFQFRHTSSGVHTVNCLARNPVFNDIKQDVEVNFTVLEPPMTHPKLFVDGEIITDGNTVTASLGTNVEVVCRVEGGYPNVARVVVECDGETNDSKGTESAMTLQIQRATHQAVCKCHADHISGCYQKTTQFSIEVGEPTFITSYTLNSRSRSVQLMAGSTLTFFCQAEGIPPPNISIKGLETGKTIPGHTTTVNYYTSKIELTKPMACDESDSYVCTSDNGIAAQTSLDALVLCPPQVFVFPKGNNKKSARVSPGGFTIIVFDLICRPHPIRFRLIKIIFSGGRLRRAGTDTEVELDPSQFQASYNDVNINRGQIELNFVDTDIDDVNDYKLEVDNGVGDAIQIEFETTMEKDSATTSGSGDPIILYHLTIVSVVGILIIIAIFVVIGYYINWFINGHTKKPRHQTSADISMYGLSHPSRTQRH